MEYIDFNAEQLRLIGNLEMQYDAFISISRSLRQLPYNLKWHQSAGKDYLYQIRNARGDANSLGPRSAKTEVMKDEYDSRKRDLKQNLEKAKDALQGTTVFWRPARLPSISHDAAKILAELDIRKMLGDSFLVVGTNAFAAYEIEAGGRFLQGWDATEDFDLAWTGNLVLGSSSVSATLFSVLKEMDSTWTINTERTFQARNARAYEVELLSAPSVNARLPKGEMSAISLKEQEWLLMGKQLERVVCSLSTTAIAARIVAPDPRWMALHKMWLSRQAKRKSNKRPKDARQGALLLQAVSERMPAWPINKAFEAEIPLELKPIYSEWKKDPLGFKALGATSKSKP
jgi:hypothetical protein